MWVDAKHAVELVEADLTKADGWAAAVAGCDYVMHTASPVPPEVPKDENDVIRPAVDGTLNVLEAVKAAGCVKRVVITSSIMAIQDGWVSEYGRTYTEDDWTDVNSPYLTANSAYIKSKTLAERAAWDFVERLSDDDRFELSVIHPGFVFGPMLSAAGISSSPNFVSMLLQHQLPF